MKMSVMCMNGTTKLFVSVQNVPAAKMSPPPKKKNIIYF